MFHSYTTLIRRLKTTQLIGVAEALHGTDHLHAEMGEFLKALIRCGSISIIFLENPISDTMRVNSWLMGERGELKNDVIPNLYGVWRTKSFCKFLSWLRDWNLNSRRPPVVLLGIDMRQIPVDVKAVLDHLSGEAKSAARRLYVFRHAQEWRHVEANALQKKKGLLRLLKKDRRGLERLSRGLTAREKKEIRGELRRLHLWINYLITSYNDFARTEEMRDLAMTEALLKNLPKNGRAAVVAHGGHLVTKSRDQQLSSSSYKQGILMGERLRKRMGGGYKPVLFSSPCVCLKVNSGRSIKIKVSECSLEAALRRKGSANQRIIAAPEDLFVLSKRVLPPTEISNFIVPRNAPKTIQTSSIHGLKFGPKRPYDFVVLAMK